MYIYYLDDMAIWHHLTSSCESAWGEELRGGPSPESPPGHQSALWVSLRSIKQPPWNNEGPPGAPRPSPGLPGTDMETQGTRLTHSCRLLLLFLLFLLQGSTEWGVIQSFLLLLRHSEVVGSSPHIRFNMETFTWCVRGPSYFWALNSQENDWKARHPLRSVSVGSVCVSLFVLSFYFLFIISRSLWT